jgi:hypothetical protein
VQAADKQLKSTRQFLEEQACERENERDEYSREVKKLQAQLREKDKDCSNRERYDSEASKIFLFRGKLGSYGIVYFLNAAYTKQLTFFP